MHEAAGSLSKDVHGNRSEHNSSCDAANDEETVTNTLDSNPVVDVEGQAKREEVLDEVHDGEGLGGLFTMAINDIDDDAGGSELNAEVDESEAYDDSNGPGVLGVECLTPSEESSGG